MKARITVLSFLLLALVFSCKSLPKSDPQSGILSPVPAAIPDVETTESESSEPEEIAEVVDTAEIDEEVSPDSDIDAEDDLSEALEDESLEDESEETLEETLVEAELIAEPEEQILEEVQEIPIQVVEDVPLPEPPPVEPQVVLPPPPPPPPPVQPPVAQVQPPVAAPPPAPPVAPPAQQNQAPTTPREPPLPPPFLGPAEPERTPPPPETFTPVIPELPSLPRNEAPETQIVFSRVVRMTVGQLLEIPFRGSGWVYQGELGNRRGLSYDSTRTDIERGVSIGQSIIFRAEAAGTYILRFYRRDYVQDYIINDYVQVIVGEADDAGRGRTGSVIDRGRIIAEPRWPSTTEAAGSITVSPPSASGAPAASGATAGTTPESQRTDTVRAAEPASPAASASTPAAPSQAPTSPPPEVISPEEYVRRAKQEFDAGRVEQALVILGQMRQRYPFGTDEAWWLLGQLYEANSPARDIKQSLECYRTLINEYPQSNRVDDARRRIAYLERYYLNIR